MRSPLISVCLPAYNAERYVRSAVESVLSQTFGDFELLVIDDGSTDKTAHVLRELAIRDSRIRLASRPNAGLVQTLNELLSQARGTFIARMDADDVSKPARFARQVAYLESHPDCVALGSRCLFIDPEGLPITEFVDRYSHEQIDASLMRPEIGILHPTVMIRLDALRKVGGYRPDYPHVEDLDLFLRLAELGRLANLPDVLLDYRCHVASVSHRHTLEQSQAGLRAVDDALIRRGMLGRSASYAAPLTYAETKAQLHRKWAWWALLAGHLVTARKHARLALTAEPWNGANLRLVASVLRNSLVERR